MILDILTPGGSILDAVQVDAVFLPGTLGEFEVLPHHAPIISSLGSGNIRYRSGGAETAVKITSGFVIVKNDHIEACVEGVQR